MALVFKKDGKKKLIDEESKLIPILKMTGWKVQPSKQEKKADK